MQPVISGAGAPFGWEHERSSLSPPDRDPVSTQEERQRIADEARYPHLSAEEVALRRRCVIAGTFSGWSGGPESTHIKGSFLPLPSLALKSLVERRKSESRSREESYLNEIIEEIFQGLILKLYERAFVLKRDNIGVLEKRVIDSVIKKLNQSGFRARALHDGLRVVIPSNPKVETPTQDHRFDRFSVSKLRETRKRFIPVFKQIERANDLFSTNIKKEVALDADVDRELVFDYYRSSGFNVVSAADSFHLEVGFEMPRTYFKESTLELYPPTIEPELIKRSIKCDTKEIVELLFSIQKRIVNELCLPHRFCSIDITSSVAPYVQRIEQVLKDLGFSVRVSGRTITISVKKDGICSGSSKYAWITNPKLEEVERETEYVVHEIEAIKSKILRGYQTRFLFSNAKCPPYWAVLAKRYFEQRDYNTELESRPGSSSTWALTILEPTQPKKKVKP
jgi:hypothetical protein